MVVLAACTGARRSEIIRSQIAGGQYTITAPLHMPAVPTGWPSAVIAR